MPDKGKIRATAEIVEGIAVYQDAIQPTGREVAIPQKASAAKVLDSGQVKIAWSKKPSTRTRLRFVCLGDPRETIIS